MTDFNLAQRGKIYTLTIANNTKPSGSLYLAYQADRIYNVTIVAPGTLTGTVGVEISHDNSTWAPLSIDGGSAVTIAASAGLCLRNIAAKYIRLNSGSNEGAARDFKVVVVGAYVP